MIELPEAKVLSSQLNKTVTGNQVKSVVANQSPHKFAWFKDDPKDYPKKLIGKKVTKAEGIAGFIQITLGNTTLVFGDGVNLKYFEPLDKVPPKHQLLIKFTDDSFLTASVQMYGGLWCYENEENTNKYFVGATQKPSPLTDKFNKTYFDKLINNESVQKLSAKAFLATEQRIPGLGNGVLQDILYNAKIHPKKKIIDLSDTGKSTLFKAVKQTLSEMTQKGGRDTETDIFGKPGGYVTKVSKNTVGKPCQLCKSKIIKQAYMGGSVYFCPGCQKL